MDDSKKNEENTNEARRKARLRARPIRSDRVFVVSLCAHAILVAWLGLHVLGSEDKKADESLLRWNSEVTDSEETPQPIVPEQVDPPDLQDDIDGPGPMVIAEPLEPAPWLRPQKAETTPNLLSPEEQASTRHTGLSAKYRTDEVVKKLPPTGTTKTPTTIKTEEPSPSPRIPVFVAARKKPGACKRPPFPRRALKRRLSGKVTFLVDVGLEGQVLSLQLEKSSGHDILDRAAKSAIETWTFIAATRDEKPVRDRVRVPITFRVPE